MTNISEISGFIWSISDSVLRGTYKRNEYQKVILPFTVLKRFNSVLEHSKKDIVDTLKVIHQRKATKKFKNEIESELRYLDGILMIVYNKFNSEFIYI